MRSTLNKLKNSYWFRSGFFTISERLSVMLMGLGSVMMLTRYFSKEEFGIWVIFLTITSILEVGRIGLLSNALIKYLSDCTEEEYPLINTASWMLNLLLTVLIALCLYGISGVAGRLYGSEELTTILRVYCLTTFLLIPFFQGNFTQQANLDFKGVFFSTATKSVFLFGYILIQFFFMKNMDLMGLAIWQAIGALAASVVSLAFAKKYLVFSRKVSRFWIKTLFDYGKFVFGTNLSAMIYKGIDKLMLGKLATTAATGLYETAIRVTNMTDVPTLAMANILFPQSARKAKEGKEAIKNLYEKAVGAILAVMLPAILFVQIFAEFIITFIAGPDYIEGANLLRLTILYGFFMPFTVQFGTVMDAVKSPRINFRFTLLSMGLNVLFNFVFISLFGVYGAAIGTLTTYLIIFIIIQVMLRKMFGVNIWNCFRRTAGFYYMALDLVRQKAWMTR